MFHIALYQPEIPQNTGNIIRLCANSGAQLHLIEPLGFELDDKRLRRAGLDYHEWATVRCYRDYPEFCQRFAQQPIYACSTKSQHNYAKMSYPMDAVFLFGPETRGLPATILTELAETSIRIPMLATSRSLNLSNAVAVILYEAWRQHEFIRVNRP